MIGLTVVGLALACWQLHAQTRESYRAVGFNDGTIHQRQAFLEQLGQMAPVVDCEEQSRRTGQRPEIFLTVKAEALYYVLADDKSMRFCKGPH